MHPCSSTHGRMPPDPPGLAVHIGTGTGRDTLERTSRLAAAAGITRQRQLPGPHASLAEVIGALRRAAAELDPRGHLLLAFTGPSDRALPHGDGPPEVSWSLYDGTLPLAQVAALLSVLPPTARITVISDTGYAAALSAFHIPATVVLLAACGADQEIMSSPAPSFSTTSSAPARSTAVTTASASSRRGTSPSPTVWRARNSNRKKS